MKPRVDIILLEFNTSSQRRVISTQAQYTRNPTLFLISKQVRQYLRNGSTFENVHPVRQHHQFYRCHSSMKVEHVHESIRCSLRQEKQSIINKLHPAGRRDIQPNFAGLSPFVTGVAKK